MPLCRGVVSWGVFFFIGYREVKLVGNPAEASAALNHDPVRAQCLCGGQLGSYSI
jgi:hypothetical protein